ncbi:hypothetical protein ABF87_12360 [Nitrosomonas sp. JL21]|uniref:hypothetical protein n=1 Tax=Nitrosomonas sp. JL21 TaxID=153949 RepID=UPI00136B638A|nr:hypothetical protein [Nitrosomonas sp. JL21]MBL8498025.1 hypothetical protein [Nitrosomonas sp.]MXS78733.1 hypothetical protein [Nitrosomonas sp. JL21]
MEKLIPQVISWAEDRNIVKGSTIEAEVLKLIATCKELTKIVDQDDIVTRLSKFIENKDICTSGIGSALIQMIVICRMRNISLYDCVALTKEVTDERLADPQFVLIMTMRYLSELSEHINANEDIKADIGYLLIYLTSLTHILELSPQECMQKAFLEVKNQKYVIFDGEMIQENDERYETAKKIIRSNHTKVPMN